MWGGDLQYIIAESDDDFDDESDDDFDDESDDDTDDESDDDTDDESNDDWTSSDGPDDDDNDDDDDGFGSAESDPEEIIVDGVYPEARGQMSLSACNLSAPPGPPYSPRLDREDAPRTHPYSRRARSITSMGYDYTDLARIRNYIRCSDVFDGEGMLNGNEHRPKRITGMAIKQKKVIYFVQWTGKGAVSIPVEADLIRNSYPHLVIEFHEKMILEPERFKNL